MANNEAEWRLIRIERVNQKKYEHLAGKEGVNPPGRDDIKIEYLQHSRTKEVTREVSYFTRLKGFEEYFHNWWGVSREQCEIYSSWLVFDQHNVGDDDMTDSNWRVLKKLFEENYPNDSHIIDKTISVRPFSKALYEAEEWADKLLDNYPLVDEDDYSQLQDDRARAWGMSTDCYTDNSEYCPRTYPPTENAQYFDKTYKCSGWKHADKCPQCKESLSGDDDVLFLDGLVFSDIRCAEDYYRPDELEALLRAESRYKDEQEMLSRGYVTLWEQEVLAA
jgi:hypothetical protein